MQALIVPPSRAAALEGEAFSFQWYLFFQTLRDYAATGANIVQSGTRADRLIYDTENLPAGADWVETDTGLTYQWRVGATADWVYISGTYPRTQAQLADLAAVLGPNDTGLLTEITDYSHILRWTGSAWEWGPGEEGSGRISMFAKAPTTAGWHACDGSAGVKYLKPDGTTGTVTLPNTAGGAAYPKLGAAYDPTINAPTDPTLSMDPYTPAGEVSQPAFTGTVSATSGESSDINVPQGAGANVSVANHSHSHSFVPYGNVSQPGFAGTEATLTGSISLPGDPVANFALMAYFRQ